MRSVEKKLSDQVDQLNNKLKALIPECDQLREDNEKLLPNVGKVARIEVSPYLSILLTSSVTSRCSNWDLSR